MPVRLGIAAVADPSAACRFASAAHAPGRDPSKAPDMQAYMKTDMPFYGVQKTARAKILRELVHRFPPADRAE